MQQIKAASMRTRLSTHWRNHRGAYLVGVLFLLLTVYYNVSIPLWESDSEWAHYQYVRYIATQRGLPAPETQISLPPTTDNCQEGAVPGLTSVHQFRQPPLYYVLGAIAISPIDVASDLPLTTNPHVFAPRNQGGVNVVVHTDAEAFPYRGAVLAVHVLRLLSGLIGLAGLIAVYLGGLLLFPQQRRLALAMMAVNAFIPQYVFSSATINNDILVGALASWCVYLVLLSTLKGPRLFPLVLAAGTAGLAVLAKYTGLALIPVVAVGLGVNLWQTWRFRREKFGRNAVVVLALAVLASLPALAWLVRNRRLYGQFFVGYSDLTYTLLGGPSQLLAQYDGNAALDPLRSGQFAFMTFWGLFGNDNLALPIPVLVALGGVALMALAGVIVFLLDKRQSRQLRAVTFLAVLFVIETWLLTTLKALGTSEPRGRYLMPVYSTVSFLLVLGTHRLLPARAQRWGLWALSGFFLVLTIAIPPLLLRPAYAPPRLASSAELLRGEQPLHVTFDGFAELVGYKIEPQELAVFDKLQVTLLWRALQSTTNNYTVGIHLLDGGNVSHGSTARYPGNGNFATSLWQPGDVFRETYDLYLDPSARSRLPSLGQLKVALYCFKPGDDQYLPVSDPQGTALGDSVYFGRLKLAAAGDESVTPASTPPSLYRWGEQIALEGFRVTPERLFRGQELAIELDLQALARPATDYTVFAHIVDGAGNQVAGNDQPLTDNYYPSGLWEAGEHIVHQHRLAIPHALPAGTYALRVGLYDPATGTRLPVYDAAGAEVPQAEIELGAYEAVGVFLFLPHVEIQAPRAP